MNDCVKKLKEVLVGKEFEEEDYYKELKNLVKGFGLEVNTCDFDNERIYNTGYEEKEDWESELVACIEKEFIPVYDEEGDVDHDIVKIVDIF